MHIDPNFTYFHDRNCAPLALPVVPQGTALYLYRAEYCSLSDRKVYTATYYEYDSKRFKLLVTR